MLNYTFFHGSALHKLVQSKLCNSIQSVPNNNSAYLINNSKCIYLKHSEKRMSPWRFTFSLSNAQEIFRLYNKFNNIFNVLVCSDNGICCLNFDEFKRIISLEDTFFPKWIAVSRNKGQKYSVVGSDVKIRYKIGNSDFPRKLFL